MECRGSDHGPVNRLDFSRQMWEIFPMIRVKADDRRRVVLPGAKPRQEFAYLERENGKVILTPIRPVKPKRPARASIATAPKPGPPTRVRFVKRGRYTVGVSDRPVDMQVVKELLADFP